VRPALVLTPPIFAPLLAAALIAASAVPAVADRRPCAPGAVHRGHAVDLDVRAADVRDVLHLLAEAGAVNLVISDDVRGTVTLRLRRVPWDLALCAVAGARQLDVVLDGGIYRIRADR